jgi:Dockerin type I domain
LRGALQERHVNKPSTMSLMGFRSSSLDFRARGTGMREYCVRLVPHEGSEYFMANTLMHRTWSVLGSGGPLPYLLIAFIFGPVLIVANAQTRHTRPPDWDAKMAALHDAGTGLIPLFALGDVNEDGQVDEQDLELVRSIVQAGGEVQPSAVISCPAAGDIDQNGRIDQRDLELLADWVKKKVTGPALSYQAVLPCDFKRFIIAASPYGKPGDAVHIRFLDADLTVANTAVTVQDGDAAAGAAPDGRGFDINVLANAKTGDYVAVKIVLPDARTYYYAFPVEDGATAGSADNAQK